MTRLRKRARVTSTIGFLVGMTVLAMSSSVHAATVTHIYELNNSFADALGGPAMVSGGGTLGATGHSFGANQGPNLSNAINQNTYSIEMLFRINSTAGFKKLLDFKNQASDTGLYNFTTAVNFFNITTGSAGAFTANQIAHMVATRDGATKQFIAYVDGNQQISFTDSTDLATFTGPNNIIHFLRDDGFQGVPGEHPSGFLDRVRIYDGVLTQSEVTALFNGGPPPGLLLADLTILNAAIGFSTPSSSNDRFEVEGEFTLGASSNGIDPVTEEVVVTVGTASVTIPAGSFIDAGGEFEFEGVISGADVEMEIEETDPGVFEFEIEADGVDLTDTTNPLDISLAIGDDAGTANLRLEGELQFELEDEEDEDDDDDDGEDDEEDDDD